MIPKDLNGKPWPLDKANAKLQEFRELVLKDLRARDKTHGIADDGKVYRIEEDSNGRQTMAIDPVLAAAKHSGAERQDMTLDMWEPFCAELRDSSLVKVPLVPSPRKFKKVERKVIDGPQSHTGATHTMSDTPAKRGRGRPRKSMASV